MKHLLLLAGLIICTSTYGQHFSTTSDWSLPLGVKTSNGITGFFGIANTIQGDLKNQKLETSIALLPGYNFENEDFVLTGSFTFGWVLNLGIQPSVYFNENATAYGISPLIGFGTNGLMVMGGYEFVFNEAGTPYRNNWNFVFSYPIWQTLDN